MNDTDSTHSRTPAHRSDDPRLTSAAVGLATPDEFEAIGALTEKAFLAGPYGHLPKAPERLAMELDAAGRAETGALLVVRDGDGTVLGTVSVLRHGTRYARSSRPGEAEVRLLAVDPDARGRGVATALLSAAVEVALEWGATDLTLDTGSINTAAQRLYDHVGFVRRPERDAPVDDPAVDHPLVFVYPLQQRDDVVVRLMVEEEADAVAALSERAYSSDYDISDSYRESIMAVADRAERHQIWVAVDVGDGDLLGTVATPRAGGAISQLAQPGELDFRLLAVDTDARRRGIGELLTRHVLVLGGLRGESRVVLNSGPEMTGAHRLYERLGFARVPERERVMHVGDASFVLMMFAHEL